MDFIESVPKFKRKDMIMVVVDRFTKFANFMVVFQALFGYLLPHREWSTQKCSPMIVVENMITTRIQMDKFL